MSVASPVGLAYSEECLRHAIPGHPERPERLIAIRERLERQGLLGLASSLAVRSAKEEETLLVHSPALVKRIKQVCASGGGFLNVRTPVCSESHEAALWAAGCLLSTVEAVLGGQVRYGFALTRPPGHHAGPDQARGFCLYNNVALAARYAQERFGLDRVAILDWDLHHGNGTQEIFYDSGQVSFLSLHVYGYPFYPRTGALHETGSGQGLGHNLNVPLPSGCGDEDYEYIFQTLVRPTLAKWEPRLLLVSAGFDGHEKDPFHGMRLTSAGFHRLAQLTKAYADAAGIGLVMALEGGYELDSLSESVSECIRALLGLAPRARILFRKGVLLQVMAVVERAQNTFLALRENHLEPRYRSSH